MSGLAGDATVRLTDALARRRAAEDRVGQTWADSARRRFADRILRPLDDESTRAVAELQQLDAELARALAILAG